MRTRRLSSTRSAVRDVWNVMTTALAQLTSWTARKITHVTHSACGRRLDDAAVDAAADEQRGGEAGGGVDAHQQRAEGQRAAERAQHLPEGEVRLRCRGGDEVDIGVPRERSELLDGGEQLR